ELQATREQMATLALPRPAAEQGRVENALMTSVQAAHGPLTVSESAAGDSISQGPNQGDQRLTKLEEDEQLLNERVEEQYQTKVESTSKYRLRLSGIVLTNAFSNHGYVDHL